MVWEESFLLLFQRCRKGVYGQWLSSGWGSICLQGSQCVCVNLSCLMLYCFRDQTPLLDQKTKEAINSFKGFWQKREIFSNRTCVLTTI